MISSHYITCITIIHSQIQHSEIYRFAPAPINTMPINTEHHETEAGTRYISSSHHAMMTRDRTRSEYNVRIMSL